MRNLSIEISGMVVVSVVAVSADGGIILKLLLMLSAITRFTLGRCISISYRDIFPLIISVRFIPPCKCSMNNSESEDAGSF